MDYLPNKVLILKECQLRSGGWQLLPWHPAQQVSRQIRSPQVECSRHVHMHVHMFTENVKLCNKKDKPVRIQESARLQQHGRG